MEFPQGDSAELRSHGAQLRAIADDVRSIAEQIDRHAEIEGFSGPAAERHREASASRVTRLKGIAQDFESLSDVVTQNSGV